MIVRIQRQRKDSQAMFEDQHRCIFFVFLLLRIRSRKAMKIRIRSEETKETMRLEIPEPFSFSDLKTLIASKLSSSSSGVAPESIRLSLNRKDKLSPDSPSAPLRSLGITSGDLIFFSCDPSPALDPMPVDSNEKLVPEAPISGPVEELLDSGKILEEGTSSQGETLNVDSQDGSALPEDDVETFVVEKSSLVPCFLKRVLDLEKGEAKGNLGLVVIAVHAVFLESGFVAVDGLKLPGGWATVSVSYTLPELIGSDAEKNAIVAVLKFALMGNYVSIYGFLNGGGSGVHRACLDVSKLLPLLSLPMDTMGEMEEEVVFKFWKGVKDGVSLPLLIDICDKNGLPPPPCLACLPIDLKIRILELLPGVDLARVGCVNSEMRYLTSNDELWRKKFLEELGLVNENGGVVARWRDRYAMHWMRMKEIKRGRLFLRPYSASRRRYIPFGPVIGGGSYITDVGDFGLGGPPRSGFLPQRRQGRCS
ncbi:putative Ubiquitin-like domain, F-box domain, Ubiquitin-like domain superfamily [Dioscorea sansibarensis]